MPEQKSVQVSSCPFFGYEVTVHYQSGKVQSFGDGYVITDGNFIHILAGTMVKTESGLQLAAAHFTKEERVVDIKRVSYRDADKKLHFYNPSKKASP